MVTPPNEQVLGEVRGEYPGRHVEAWVVGAVVSVGATAVLASLRPAWWSFVLPVSAGALLFGLFWLLTPRRAVLRAEGLELHRWLLPPRTLPFADVS
jgi:hypothetical protein